MKRISILILLMLFVFAGNAQKQQKWKTPKQPERPKWEAPKQKAPEVINVWRTYTMSDNWFFDFYGGVSLSMAENMKGHGLGEIWQPLFDFGLGKQFSPVWSTRLTLGYKRQKGWASKEAIAASTLLGDGDYTFQMASLYLDELMSITNIFCPYNELRRLDVQLLAGFGLNYSFGFDDKVDRWTRYGYPVDGSDHINMALRAGLLFMYKLGETVDLSLQGTYNMVGDNYNGVKHSPNSALDSYLDIALGVRVHLMDHYGNSRYYKVRRWEATSLRGTESKVAKLLDDEKRKEYEERAANEVVAYGELMKTHIAFYVDRTFVNDDQLENLRIIADFLKNHPDVNIVVKGYSGASTKSESPDMHLAEKRVAMVKKALQKYYDVDPSRFETWFDENAEAPFPMKSDWIDAVVFQMERK